MDFSNVSQVQNETLSFIEDQLFYCDLQDAIRFILCFLSLSVRGRKVVNAYCY